MLQILNATIADMIGKPCGIAQLCVKCEIQLFKYIHVYIYELGDQNVVKWIHLDSVGPWITVTGGFFDCFNVPNECPHVACISETEVFIMGIAKSIECQIAFLRIKCIRLVRKCFRER